MFIKSIKARSLDLPFSTSHPLLDHVLHSTHAPHNRLVAVAGVNFHQGV